jgi:phosphoribosyl 1,2-cyclic phosphodiesterase
VLPTAAGRGVPELRLDLGGLTVVGMSLGSLATAFAVPEAGVAVDMGRCSRVLADQPTVLVTHCHSDHAAGLLAWLSARTLRPDAAASRVVVPAPRREALLAAVSAWPDLRRVHRFMDLQEVVVAAEPGDRIELPGGGWARAFATRHTVPSLGWQLRVGGSSRPRLVFTGDTSVDPVRAEPELLATDAAVVDCSFVGRGERLAARLSGHGHLQDWLELLPDLPCTTLVLAHLPADVAARQLRAATDGLVPAGRTVVPWLAEP